MVAIVLTGLVAYALLPLAALPQVDFPTLAVQAALPGADAETMAATVAAPLEQQFQQIPGLAQMTSTNMLGRTSITLQFDLARNIDAAAQDVQTAINAAGGLLPKALPNPPTYHKVNPAQTKVLTLAVTSDELPLRIVDEYANTFLGRQISQIPGVGLVDMNGEQKPAIRVQVNPAALASMGLTMEDVRSALEVATVDAPKGILNGRHRAVTLDTNDQILDAATANEAILAYRRGAPIRVRDIGRAVDDVENNQVAGWYNAHPAILVDIHPEPGANLVETIDRIRAALPDLRRQLPPPIKVTVVGDRSLTIRAAIADVQFTLSLTVALVVMVMFLFLRNLWATIIPSVAIPISLIGTFGAMYLLGYSLDNLSFMALTIAVGFVVDDAIVMIENIVRHIEAGEDRLTAAFKGAREIAFTIVSMTTSLIAVFIPLLLMGGIMGRLFREFAVTVTIALIVSAVVSLTLTPMMCGRLIRRQRIEAETAFGRSVERGFGKLLDGYRSSLRWTLAHAPFMLGVAIALMGITIILFIVIPKGFFPQQDVGLIVGTTETGQDSSFAAMKERQQEVGRLVMEDPDVASITSFIEPSQLNAGRIYLNLKPFAERSASADDIIRRIRRRVAALGDVSYAMQAVQDIQVGGRLSRTQYQYTLQDSNIVELYKWAATLRDKLASLPELRDATSDLQANGPQANIVVDRDTAGRLGVTPQAIDDVLYDAFGQRQVATIFTQLDQFHVVLEVDPKFQLDTEALGKIYVRSANGSSVPLSAFTRIGSSVTPSIVAHQGQFPAVTLSFNLARGVSLGNAVAAVEKAHNEIGMPATVRAGFQGTAQAFQASLASEPYLILAAIVAVYIVLGILYESTIHPITILSTLPSAGVGALLALMLTGGELNVMSLVGIILLIGIVKKNAIMMIDFAISAGAREDPVKAIYDAALLRFRPIMMTTMTALLGSLPLALGTGVGSELRRPLGVAVVGGLLVSQLLTLYTTPVVFLYLERLRIVLAGIGRRYSPPAEAS
jgi:HAE1 family hydrophobic/amphiphilic exporter-1/multidrug efflux pump